MATDSTKTFAGPQAYSPSRSGGLEYYMPEGARLRIHIDITPTSLTDFGETASPAWTEANTEDSEPSLNDNSIRGREIAKQPPKAAPTPTLGHASDLDSNTEQQGVKTRVIYSFKGQASNELDIELNEMVLPIENGQGAVCSHTHPPYFYAE